MALVDSFAWWLLVVVIAAQGVLGDGLISFSYSNFNSSDPTISPVNANVVNGGMALTQAGSGTSTGAIWYAYPIQVRGFKMTFSFTVTGISQLQRRDGMAFVIQQEGNSMLGPGAAGLGYGDINEGESKGISQSVAIEFDSFYDPTLGDPDSVHVSVHSNPTGGANSANESFSIWRFDLPQYNLTTQTVTMEYVPSLQTRGTGQLSMSLTSGGITVPLGSPFNIPLDNLLALDNYVGSAYVGFTASHGPGNDTYPGEAFTVNSWSFTFTGVIQASNCIVFGLDYAEAGAGLVFYLQSVDNYGYNMTTDGILASGQTPLVTLIQPDGSQQNGTINYTSNGLYKLFLNATISGNATVNIFLGSQRLGPSAYTLAVFPTVPYPATSYSYGVAEQVTAGAIGSFWVQLRDVYNNNITTNASVPVVSITGTGLSQPAVVTFDTTSGRYLVAYNVTLAGTFNIGITLNGSPTDDPTYPLEVVPAALDSPNSLAYGMATSVVAGTVQTVMVQLRDVFGNNVTDETANVTLSVLYNAIEVFGTRSDLGGGLYSFAYNATTMGTYNLAPVVNGVALSTATGYYTPIVVLAASINPAVSYAYGAGLTQGTAGYLTVLYVQLTDSFGNNVSVPNISVRADLPEYSIQPITTPVQNGVGLFMISYNITVATTYTLQVQAAGVIVTYGSSTVTIQPAEVDPASCVAYGVGLTGTDLIVGNINAFSVQLRDRYLNNITTAEAPLTVVITDLLTNQTHDFTSAFESGAYQVSYNITLASDYLVSLAVAGDPILNPLTNMTLFPADIYPATCVASGDLETNAVAGVLRVFYVQLRDVYSNNIVDVPDNNPNDIVTSQFTSLDHPAVPVNIAYNQNGLYSCSYNATVTGSYTLQILVLGAGIQNANTAVQVIPAPAYAPYCMAEGDSLTTATAGALVSFTIYLYDVFNNSIPPTITAPVVSITTPSEQVVSVIPDEALGVYTATYNITESATYTVDITISGVQIGTPPASLTVNPAPLSIPNSIATGSTLTGTAGTQGAITLIQRDIYGNAIKDYSQVNDYSFVMALASDPTVSANVSKAENGDGSFALTYDITLAGEYTNTITINGVNILGSPFDTVVNPANFDPHGTTTVGLDTSVTAGDANAFSVQLRDIYGNDITENVVSPDNITLLLNGNGVTNNITLQGEGVYDIVYNQTVAGTYTMSITIDEVPIGTTPIPPIIVNPAETYAPACYATGEAISKAYVKRDNSFILVVRDRYLNHKNGSEVQPTVTISTTGQETVYGSFVLNPDGNYTVTYAGINNKATYTLSVTFSGQHIQGSPFSVQSAYSNDAPNTLMIVGIVIGCVAFVGIAAFFGYRVYKKRHAGYEYLA